MCTVKEIKKAVEKLSLEERAELAKWFNEWEDDGGRQMQEDACNGSQRSSSRSWRFHQ